MNLIIPMFWQGLLTTKLTPEHPAAPTAGPCRQDARTVSAKVTDNMDLVLLLISDDEQYELYAILETVGTSTSIPIKDTQKIFATVRQWIYAQIGSYPELSIVWKSEKPHVDMFGIALTPGSYFVYAALIGRSAMLKIGRVVACTHELSYDGTNLEPAITAVTINPLSGWPEKGRIQKSGKPVTLTFLDRLVCAQPSSEWKKLLDEAWEEMNVSTT